MNRTKMMVFLALAAALALPACSGDGGSTSTAPKIEPPPPMSWTAQVNSLNPSNGVIRVGQGVLVKGEYTALEDLPGGLEGGIIVGFLDGSGRSLVPLGGQAPQPTRVGRWGFQMSVSCDLPGEVKFLQVVIGKGSPKWSPNLSFSGQVLGHWEFPVEYTCKSRG